MNERIVRRTLGANAAFSSTSGLSLLLLAGSLAPLLGVRPSWILQLIGGGLVFFALGVAAVARRSPIRRAWVVTISMMDLGWVLGTVGLALSWPEVMSRAGWIAAALVALIVMLFATRQLYGMRLVSTLKHTGKASRFP